MLQKHPHTRLLQRLIKTDLTFYGPIPVPISFVHEDLKKKLFIPMPVVYCARIPIAIGHTWLLEVAEQELKLLEVTDKFALYSIESGLTLRELVDEVNDELLKALTPQPEQLSRCLTFEADLDAMEEVSRRKCIHVRLTLSQLMNRTGFKPWS